jgi:hypothetical protein
VDSDNERLAQALREGNARYEARFGRVFLIRNIQNMGAQGAHSPIAPSSLNIVISRSWASASATRWTAIMKDWRRPCGRGMPATKPALAGRF